MAGERECQWLKSTNRGANGNFGCLYLNIDSLPKTTIIGNAGEKVVPVADRSCPLLKKQPLIRRLYCTYVDDPLPFSSHTPIKKIPDKPRIVSNHQVTGVARAAYTIEPIAKRIARIEEEKRIRNERSQLRDE